MRLQLDSMFSFSGNIIKIIQFHIDFSDCIGYNVHTDRGKSSHTGAVMNDDGKLELALERIAKMEHAGVSHAQIAAACGFDIASLSKLMEKDRFKDVLAKIAGEDFDKFNSMNEGWDMIEGEAMTKIIDHLQRAPDPDYALKAATLANKAVRRGKHQNNAINVQPNSQAIIQVSVAFAEKLGQTFNVSVGSAKNGIKKKDDNFLAPKMVHNLLQEVKPQVETDIEADFADLGIMATV